LPLNFPKIEVFNSAPKFAFWSWTNIFRQEDIFIICPQPKIKASALSHHLFATTLLLVNRIESNRICCQPNRSPLVLDRKYQAAMRKIAGPVMETTIGIRQPDE